MSKLTTFTVTNGPADDNQPGFKLELPEGDCTVTFTPNIPKENNDKNTPMLDPYAGRVELGRMVMDAAKAAVHDEQSIPDLARLNSIAVCDTFVSALVESGCMITRIPTKTMGGQQ